jgi:hypothetical protein
VLDIKWIRDNQDAFVKGLKDRAFDDPKALLNRILKLDEERRGTIQQLQDAQARRNEASKAIGKAKAAKDEKTSKRSSSRARRRSGNSKPSFATCSPAFPTRRCPMCRSAMRKPTRSSARLARRSNFRFRRSSISRSAKRSG